MYRHFSPLSRDEHCDEGRGVTTDQLVLVFAKIDIKMKIVIRGGVTG